MFDSGIVDRADFPLFQGVYSSILQSPLLFLFRYVEIVGFYPDSTDGFKTLANITSR